MTVPVSVQQRIRVLDAHGMSWRSIAKEVGVARDTVAKYAGREDCSPGPERSVSRPSKLDPFRATVDGWLQADRFMPRKQRHTAKRVYDRLVSEKGYEGSYSPVQRYVKRWREEHRLPSDGYLELKWHPGEAQVDFGMAQAVVGGDRVDVHCLVVTFPYSNMRYCVALPGENAECVCAGLRTVFEHIGAVPLTLVLDAMAKETHYRKGAPIGGLFAGEKMDMQPLPAKPYDAIRWEVRKADKDGRVQIDGNYYLAGPSWRGWTLDVGLRAFDVTIRTQDGRTCARLPRVYGDSPATVRNPATLLPALSRKTHAWTDSTIRDDFPDKLRIAIDRMDAKTRRTTFRVIAKASAASGFEAAVRAGEHLVEQGHAIDEASVTTMARRIAAGEKPYEQSVPDLTGYDVFMKPRQPWERKEA